MKNDRLKERLQGLGQHIKGGSSTKPIAAVPGRYQKLAEATGGKLITDPAGCFCLIKKIFDFGYSLGSAVLTTPEPNATVAAASFCADEREGAAPLDQLLFFDTETTGLGGAGAVPFLVGCGSLTERGFEVRQYLLPDYADEAAMLEHVLTEFGDQTTLVSYNGLAFDINLLRDRMIVNRVGREIPQAGHFDLLHGARRLWRRRLADCRLTNIERELFGFYRDDDIPGHLIPSVYFDWLQADDLRFMGSVLEHNQYDILSLYFLLLRINEVFHSDGASLDSADDLYSLSRVYGRRRQAEKVTDQFEALQKSAVGPIQNDVLLYYSLAFKRQGDWPQAVELWESLASQTGREAHQACLELAKYYEHRVKDCSRALEFSRQAGQFLGVTQRHQNDLRTRVSRLKNKLGR